MPRTSGCVVTQASQPRCSRIATTQAQNPGMTPSPIVMGTAATRAPWSGTQTGRVGDGAQRQVAQAEAGRLEQPCLEGLEVAA